MLATGPGTITPEATSEPSSLSSLTTFTSFHLLAPSLIRGTVKRWAKALIFLFLLTSLSTLTSFEVFDETKTTGGRAEMTS
jgi:hypothetical protein